MIILPMSHEDLKCPFFILNLPLPGGGKYKKKIGFHTIEVYTVFAIACPYKI